MLGHFEATGIRPRFLGHLASQGITFPAAVFDPTQTSSARNWTPPCDFDPVYLVYLLIGVSAAMFAERAFCRQQPVPYRKTSIGA